MQVQLRAMSIRNFWRGSILSSRFPTQTFGKPPFSRWLTVGFRRAAVSPPQFSHEDLSFLPHRRSSTVLEILKHQLLSGRRFFGEFFGTLEPAASEVLPQDQTVEEYVGRMLHLAKPRPALIATQHKEWWLGRLPFFYVERERIWIIWRRVLHTAHHRAQLTGYLPIRLVP